MKYFVVCANALIVYLSCMACAHASALHVISEISEADKSPPLPELAPFNPSAEYRKVDAAFVRKTRFARDYVSWVDRQTNITSKSLHVSEEFSHKLIYISHDLAKIVLAYKKTRRPLQVAYYKNGLPVVMYAYLFHHNEADIIQYYSDGRLLYVELVDGPGDLRNVWYRYGVEREQHDTPTETH